MEFIIVLAGEAQWVLKAMAKEDRRSYYLNCATSTKPSGARRQKARREGQEMVKISKN